MRDFAIPLTHRPGELARVAHALARKAVNIRTLAAMTINNHGLVRLIADDVDAARTALKEGHIPFEEHEVVTTLLENQAGEIEGATAKLAEAGVNLLALYVVGLAGDMVELAFIVDDPKKAKKLLE